MKKPKIRRIICLYIAGVIVGSIGLSACGNHVTGNDHKGAAEGKHEPPTAEANVFAMDTFMNITAYGEQAEAAVRAAEEEIARLDQLLSAQSSESEVGRLNETGVVTSSEDTSYLLQRSLDLYQQTDGAFNIMIYPLMETWGFIDGAYQVPSQEIIDQLLPLTDVSKVSYDSEQGQIRFLEKGMKADFGGIAKGYTSSRIMDIFERYNIASGVVNLGGNVQLKGKKADGTHWRIGIKDPKEEESYLGILEISDKAVITSGGYERFFEDNGVRYHHILDPKTGKPAQNGLSSVTIVSEDGTLADGLSTALFVMGLEKAEQYWLAHANEFDAILVTDGGALYVTEGIAAQFKTDADEVHIIQKKHQ